MTAEVYPTAIRATAQGFTYNIGRVASAVAPFAVGSLAQTHGFSAALSICSVAFLLAAFTWIWIPETLRPGAGLSRAACAPRLVSDADGAGDACRRLRLPGPEPRAALRQRLDGLGRPAGRVVGR